MPFIPLARQELILQHANFVVLEQQLEPGR